jgi:hypothetical protein
MFMKYDTRNYCDEGPYDDWESTLPPEPAIIKRIKKPLVRKQGVIQDLRTGKPAYQSNISTPNTERPHHPKPSTPIGVLANGIENWNVSAQLENTLQPIDCAAAERSRDQYLTLLQEIAEISVANSLEA